MYYVKQEGNELVKYEVKLNHQILKSLQYTIRKKCGEIIHRDIEDTVIRDDEIYIFNLKTTKLGIKENCSGDYESVYRYEYDYIIEPDMCKMIFHLLNGDVSMIERLENYVPQKSPRLGYYETLDNEMQKEMDKLLGERSIEKMKSIVEGMEEYKRYLEYNPRKSEMDYKEEVLSLISLTRVSSISEVDFALASEFMQEIQSSNIDSYMKVKQ